MTLGHNLGVAEVSGSLVTRCESTTCFHFPSEQKFKRNSGIRRKNSKYQIQNANTHDGRSDSHTHTNPYMLAKCVQMMKAQVGGAMVMEAENSNIKNLQFKGDLLRLVKQTQ